MTCDCLRRLAQELAEPVLFDEGVEAARNACVAGAPLASAAITASAWYANPLTGVPALRHCLELLLTLPLQLPAWQTALAARPHPETLDPAVSPGFGFCTALQARAVLGAAQRLRGLGSDSCRSRLGFFLEHQPAIGPHSGALNQAGLAALVFADHGFDLDRGEREFLMLRIAPALAEAAQARRGGVRVFPFFSEEYRYEGTRPPVRKRNLEALMREVGLD